MSKRMLSLLLTAGLLGATACADTSGVNAPPPALRSPPTIPSRQSLSWAHICSIGPTPNPVTIYVGQHVTLDANDALCNDTTGRFAGYTTANFESPDPAIATGGGVIQAFSTTITGVGDGQTGLSVYDCCDINHNVVQQYVTINVAHAPLTVSAVGPTSVTTDRDCQYEASTSGGYPGYTYQWQADGTIEGSSTQSSVTVRFTDDGVHLLSVRVTDSNGQQATGSVYVTSSTPDPPPITCEGT